jgi:hypothetical protein
MANSNGSLKGLKAKSNGLDGHVNGKVTELGAHINGALNGGIKPNLNSHAVVPRRNARRQQRGFVVRSFSIIAR